MDLSLVYDELTGDDAGRRLTARALCDAMAGFWRAYDAAPPRGDHTPYDRAMDGYRSMAHDAFERYTGSHGFSDRMLDRERQELADAGDSAGAAWIVCFQEEDLARRTEVYRQELASIIRAMVPYRKQQKTAAFAHKGLLPEIHRMIHGMAAARASPCTLSQAASGCIARI